jgi:glycyl-tRNA synthetase beta chain
MADQIRSQTGGRSSASFYTEVKMEKLLLEIGTEEIPAGYIDPALAAMAEGLDQQMRAARIAYGKMNLYGTPRRLAIMVDGVAAKQEALTEELVGPPAKVAFDANGKPTVAAQKFAEKAGMAVDKLTVKQMPKGEYLCAQRKERGQATTTLMKTILPELIGVIPFPKSMKWGSLHVMFARPIHTIVALLGKKLISFTFGDVKSGRMTRGHYFMAPAKIKIDHPDNYLSALTKAKVNADIASRRKAVVKSIEKAADSVGGAVLPDEELVDIVTNLVEYPAPVIGRFEEKFLDLPPEILITAMREHQKYFALVDRDDKLMSAFVAVNNTVAKNMDLVAEGHGRVIRARLADAAFFYESDTAADLDQWVEELKGVTFQADLGTMHAKTLRVQQLAEYVCDHTGQGNRIRTWASRAALLSKADLVSEMVGEFPKLQGVMGRIYAGAAGEPRAVADAIEEHYRPVASGAALPASKVGALVSITDKLDSVCGFFSIGLTPTGGADPYALRRQGIGALQVIRDQGFDLSLSALIDEGLKLHGVDTEKKRRAITDKILGFLKNRINRMLSDEGYPKGIVAAATQVSIDSITDVWKRTAALNKLRSEPDFDDLAGAFKRVTNIIRKAEMGKLPPIDPKLFEDESERALFKACNDTARRVETGLKRQNYDGVLKEIATLKKPVDRFFDDVMVMVKTVRLRNNRLALLSAVESLFGQVADFTLIN